MNKHALLTIGRVIRHASAGKWRFYTGIVFRILERCIAILPLLLSFYWLQQQFEMSEHYWLWLATPVDYLLALAGCFLAQLICAYIGQYQSFVGSYRIVHTYRIKLINHVRQLPLGHLQRARSGEFLEILTEDIKKIESIFSHTTPDLISALMTPVIGISVLFFVNPVYAMAILLLLPLAFLVMQITKQKFIHVASAKRSSYRQTASCITDYIEALKTLKLYDQTKARLAHIATQLEQTKQHSLQVEMWGAGPVLTYRVVLNMALTVFVILLAVTLPEQQSGIDFTSILFALLMVKILEPLFEVAEHLRVLRIAIQSEHKLESILNEPVLVEPTTVKIPLNFDIELENISFYYKDNKVIDGVNFCVKQGSTTAIVGASGSGKSTLLNLCARFFEPNSGRIKIGGIDLNEIGSKGVHQLVSMVFQDIQLIDASIAENIRIGSPSASDEEVMQACKLANCLDFINQQPEGMNARVGDSGLLLSGGQRQRIAIARALLKDAPIILLDEATASLDPITQTEIVQAMSNLLQNRTVITVAHRLSSIVNADNIIVLKDGKVVESGGHHCLLSRDGYYTQLWNA
ncbi:MULTISPECIES: ABC transporter ATP-binding protein [unclassified Pseudoalteromonas]|uniref:ABC transporter ATP-binding protein n=1 Tax=unclassified Pseudoalteromonas TaxID=194690 RepID=UPI0025B3B537|nr:MULTISPECIES: ABC transporter ATP-binding protein [unclassified Pseudoalteromonas]MDN3379506.1 ABC transporter ATP-binding protein [Pseudoalteromonas sp. APC 3893]MDN3387846.1 ABC transporter ATP-binding protein [Pseudoalteromonas sp. APC 4017]